MQENLRTEKEKELDVDPRYLSLLGFLVDSTTTRDGGSHSFNNTKKNFSVVSYVQVGQLAASILHLQNIASVMMPSENLVIYNLGLSETDLLTLSTFCNSSTVKCSVVQHDFSQYPSYIMDDKLHLFRPLIIKHALSRYKTILFTANHVRLRGSSKLFSEIRKKTEETSHVESLEIKKLPITSNTHPRMFDYFESDADSFLFVRQVTLDAVFFHHSKFLDDNILLPWIKCVLTPQCIQPIGASFNANHCKYKKPRYRYSGCHNFDESAFNVVCGLAFNFNEAKYSVSENDGALFYKQSLDDSVRILENRKKNISETSEHPYNED